MGTVAVSCCTTLENFFPFTKPFSSLRRICSSLLDHQPLFKPTTMKTPNTFRLSTRIAPFAIFFLTLFSCKKDDDNSTPVPEVNNNLFSKVELATTGESYSGASSAVPDAANQFTYFTALDAPGTGVYKVPAVGGNAMPVFTGTPFSKPIDLVLSTDNQTIFVADFGADAILSLNISGSTPMAVMGTSGTKPVALDVIQKSGSDVIYFCGTNASDGQPSIFEIASGVAGSAMLRYKGAPLMNPTGIVSAKDGTLYIADKNGKVFKLTTANVISEVASGVIMGEPAGIALTPDDQNVAVSSKSRSDGTAQVHVVSLSTGKAYIFNKVISANSNPGGLHAARNASGATGIYAWSDIQKPGHVYVVYR
jgi:hypothetical protein